jgi:hypothetical protein
LVTVWAGPTPPETRVGLLAGRPLVDVDNLRRCAGAVSGEARVTRFPYTLNIVYL